MKEDLRKRGAARVPSRGPELLGGALFLAGCLPAVALLKALRDSTDLTSDGLGGTAALAARIAAWVGAWPGLMMAGAIAAFGAMAVLGAIRTDLLRRVVGVGVCGLGVALISSALVAGSGGRIGDGTGARLAEAVGPWAGILAGLGVVVVALWLAFARAPKTGSRTLAVSLDGPELRRASAARPGPDVKEIDAPRRKRRRKSPSVETSASMQAAKAHQHELAQPETVEPEAREPEAVATTQPPAPRAAEPVEVEPSREEPARPSMPGLEREPDPVVDGPSSGANEGGLSLTAITGWFGGLASSIGARWGRKRPRVAMPTPRKSEPKTLGDALVRGEAEGVSHDEAAALAPDGDTLAYMEEVWRKASESLEQVEPVPPSPYPEDPRLKGEIPPGTTPLGGSVASSPESAMPAPVREPDPAAALHAEVAPFDLMDDEEHGPVGSEGLHPPASTSIDPPVSEGATLDLPGGVAPIRPEDVEGIALPRPPASWEAGFEDESLSDSDGTWTRGETSAAGDSLETAVGALEVEVTDEATETEDEPPAEETAEETAEEAASDDDVDEEEPEEEEDEEEVEYEYVDEDGNPIDISSLEDSDYELVDEDEYEEVEEEDDAEYEEADEDEAAEYEEEDEDDEDEEEDEDDGPDGSFDDGDEYEEADEDEEPVVLEPQSPPAPASSQSERLLNAGRVLVRQGRVAVSVLQQELDMEFDEACELLDQLQAEGLIGPYKGGKKRDILLSEEEWEDHFARS